MPDMTRQPVTQHYKDDMDSATASLRARGQVRYDDTTNM